MAHAIKVRPRLHPNMSLTESLSAVRSGTVTYQWIERGGDWIPLWTDSASSASADPWCRAGKGLNFGLRRGLIKVHWGRATLTPLGRRRFAQLSRP